MILICWQLTRPVAQGWQEALLGPATTSVEVSSWWLDWKDLASQEELILNYSEKFCREAMLMVTP